MVETVSGSRGGTPLLYCESLRDGDIVTLQLKSHGTLEVPVTTTSLSEPILDPDLVTLQECLEWNSSEVSVPGNPCLSRSWKRV